MTEFIQTSVFTHIFNEQMSELCRLHTRSKKYKFWHLIVHSVLYWNKRLKPIVLSWSS